MFAQPFTESDSFALRGLGFGIAGTYGDQEGATSQTLLSAYRTPAQATFFTYRTGATATIADGERTRLAPQFYYSFGQFGFLGEDPTVSPRDRQAPMLSDIRDHLATWFGDASV